MRGFRRPPTNFGELLETALRCDQLLATPAGIQPPRLLAAWARLRHPQYVGFIAIMVGFLLQWPTILTVLMFPLLVWIYVHLALSEERDAEREFGDTYTRYAAATPRWIPHWGPPGAAAHPGP